MAERQPPNGSGSHLALDTRGLLRKHLPTDRLCQYFDLLMAENQKVNLVSRETSRCDLERLAAESILPLEVCPGPFERYLDIGSGGGFPAIPILLSSTTTGPAVLVERTNKKCLALERMLSALGLGGSEDNLGAAQILHRTFEEVTLTEPYDLITLRYVKLTQPLLKKILVHLAAGGRLIYYSRPEFCLESGKAQLYSFDDSGISSQGPVNKSFTIITKN